MNAKPMALCLQEQPSWVSMQDAPGHGLMNQERAPGSLMTEVCADMGKGPTLDWVLDYPLNLRGAISGPWDGGPVGRPTHLQTGDPE